MNPKETLLTEIEAIPESLIPDVLNYVQYIKYKHQSRLDHTEEMLASFNQNEKLETTILSESLLASDWSTPEEDEAWQHL
jgi:hypothetical protein